MARLYLKVMLPFLIIKLLDFFGLNVILAHVAISSSFAKTHRAWTWEEVVIVRSSM